MIQILGLSKSYGEQVLFKNLSFSINRGDKIGLVGRNGVGKSTLFAMLLDDIEPDDGSILFPRNYRIGHVKQYINFTQSTALEEGCLGLQDEEKHNHWKVEKVLSGLGFNKDDLSKHPSVFSGGYQIRLNLAKVLVSFPDLLLLDEPNNYLDIVATRWLTGFLKSWKTEIMLITHDRNFMDNITTHTMIIHRNTVKKNSGDTAKLYNQIAQEEEIHEKTRIRDEKERKKTELFIRRFRAKARLGGMVQSRIKTLQKREKQDKLKKIDNLEFTFNTAPFPAAQMMQAYNIGFSYDQNEANLIDDFSISLGKRERICVIGRNGRGKSTLLRILAGELKSQLGNIKMHAAVKIGYFGQSNIARLRENKTVLEEVGEGNPNSLPQNVRNICGAMMFSGDDALKKIKLLSGGEKSRVLLGRLLMSPSNLLLLDEPTNHLDMESCDALLESIDNFDGSLVIVSHNEMILNAIANRFIIFDRGRVTVFDGTYGEFLQKIGWQDEEGEYRKQKKKNVVAVDRKALKKMKGKLIQDRSQILNPLGLRIKELERVIAGKEKEMHQTTAFLVKASTKGDVSAITELSQKHHELRSHIDSLYGQMEESLSKYEKKCEYYKQRLAEFDTEKQKDSP
ncbi:ABC-F family ATP-binding cassette domain-containing protein [bacterium]|nr:ABC-F family ATP-binding cassette domain-containing protein [bacterium]